LRAPDTTKKAGRIAWAALGLICLAAGGASAAEPVRPTPSGLPVPRYVSLKFDEVNARSGPGDDYRLLWVYRARGLPVQVVAETSDWRRVCDPQGGLAWVKATGVDSRRSALNAHPSPLPLRAKPDPSAMVKAYLASKAVAALDRCQGGWCRVKAASAAGWLKAADVWGTDESRQCH
jgi:SH3-like domain-containing protein